MELLPNEEESMEIESYVFEKVNQSKYLGLTITNNSRIHKAEKAYFALRKYFISKIFYRGTKIRLYLTIIRPSVTYWCEVWPTTQQLEKKLLRFEKY